MTKKNKIIITKTKKSAKAKITKFSDFKECFIEDLKNNPRDQEIYLKLALEEYEQEKNPENFLLALRTIAVAKGGMSDLAKKTKLNRESLYKSLSAKGNPSFLTVDSVLNCLGFRLEVRSV